MSCGISCINFTKIIYPAILAGFLAGCASAPDLNKDWGRQMECGDVGQGIIRCENVEVICYASNCHFKVRTLKGVEVE